MPAVATAQSWGKGRSPVQRRLLGVQFEQEQLPPQAQPPALEAVAPSPEPITAKVENIARVLVPSHCGQTWR
jgi:hypothetical protein